MSLQSLLFPPKPVYFFRRISLPALTAGSCITYDLDGYLRTCRKFVPFSNFQLVNDSETELEILLDFSPNKKLRCLGKGTKAIRNQPFNSFIIYNVGTVDTGTDDIQIELETIR